MSASHPAPRPATLHATARVRQPYRAAKAFYLTLFIVTCLATLALFTHSPSPTSIHKRDSDINPFRNDDEECRLVHRTPRPSQCAFVKKHCPADEAGFAAYLDLYYCRMPHLQPLAFILLVSWLGLLFSTIGIAASDFFCINLSTIAALLGLSESMAGVTFLAFGNGSPDVFSTFAAMSTNSGSLAVGELFGAAGFITAVVAGSMALIRPFHVAKKSFIRDVGFFVVASAFSIAFLADGKLKLWECISMVAFYIFYVAFVVVWHWWLGRRRRRREKDAAARGHFLPPGDELEVEQEAYHDEDDEGPRPTFSRGASREDWSALLENGSSYPPYTDHSNDDEDEEEEARERWMSELSSNMRLTRPARSRRNTLNPVRPSLVGALEFQAVLKSLQKSRNHQTIPLHARRYSDDPVFTSAQQQEQMSNEAAMARPVYGEVTMTESGTPRVQRQSGGLEVPKSAPAGARMRAVSANDASSLRLDPDLRRLGDALPSRQQDLTDMPDEAIAAPRSKPSSLLDVPKRRGTGSPSIEISPATPRPEAALRVDTGDSAVSALSSNFLTTPDQQGSGSFGRTDLFSHRSVMKDLDSPAGSPRSVPTARQLPRISIPGREGSSRQSTPAASPRIRLQDIEEEQQRPPSLHLPPPVASPESVPASQQIEAGATDQQPAAFMRLLRWWPHTVLPPPGVIVSTLFPTIYHWREKSWWEKALGIVAAPSVFLLTITLPVMENEKEEEASGVKEGTYESTASASKRDAVRSMSLTVEGLKGVVHEESGNEDVNEREPHLPGTHRHSLAALGSRGSAGANGQPTLASLATSTEQQQRHNFGRQGSEPHRHASISAAQPTFVSSPAQISTVALDSSNPTEDPSTEGPQLWNRWLTMLQLFLAPLFIVLSLYTQSPTSLPTRWLLRPSLICLLISLILLIPLLITTTPTHRPPAYRAILSLAGFIVSIAWISTIAAQVVGALKALAVVLNMSHAIMGLTIFAVGNSLGDLVADVTVAKLGYPVMALSACFGGPMLNILLGIGLSGSWILIRGATNRHEKHPDKGMQFKAYHIDVSPTLIVSGATLLLTLLGLLIVVPWNRWVLSRRIGWALIGVWVVSTVGNVILEVTGFGNDWTEG